MRCDSNRRLSTLSRAHALATASNGISHHPASLSLVADVPMSGISFLDNLPDDLVEEIWSIVVNDTREDTMQELLFHTPVVAPVRIKACSWCGISRECRYCEGCLSGVRARYCSKSCQKQHWPQHQHHQF